MNSENEFKRISHKNYIQNDMPAEIPEKIQEKTKFSEIPPSESPEVPPEPSPEESRKGINQILDKNTFIFSLLRQMLYANLLFTETRPVLFIKSMFPESLPEEPSKRIFFLSDFIFLYSSFYILRLRTLL